MKTTVAVLGSFAFSCAVFAADLAQDATTLDACNVTWTEFAKDSQDSMPTGNGDIGLNVWTEANGDALFYISKTDAWSEAQGTQLVKLGRVRVTLNPDPFTATGGFTQTLKLRESEIVVSGGGTTLRLWVDANAPEVHIEMEASHPTAMAVALDPWRAEPKGNVSADVVVPDENDRITWYHRNGEKPANPELAGRTFGAVILGEGFQRTEGNTLRSRSPAMSASVSIFPLTTAEGSDADWLSKSRAAKPGNIGEARAAHRQWWDRFWNRSHIFLSGDADAAAVTQGYTLQRYITACAGRGAFAIKFNGSIFTTDFPGKTRREKGSQVDIPDPLTADDRSWGGQYWFQNTRPMYWPRLAAGDFDLMRPLFKMYEDMLPRNAARVKEFYGHEGAYFRETAPFWGDLTKLGPESAGNYTAHYYLPILELCAMMLDYYDYTGDQTFARDSLLPMCAAGLTFYDQHFPRSPDGKLLLEPVNSIEMFWKVRNPAPDLAAFYFLLPRLLALPDDLADAKTKAGWRRLLGEMPAIPSGEKNGKRVLLPYEGEQTSPAKNSEVPELYAVYPFRIYGVGKPDLQIALDTFDGRAIKRTKCWHQDPVWAAYLGLADDARRDVTRNLTNRDPRLRFPAFWEKGHDYAPDQDNGGNGELALQRMLLQSDGRRLLLLPAWPVGWNADFKLHAPLDTTVEGRVENGNVTRLEVTPSSRRKDVEVMSPHKITASTSSGGEQLYSKNP
jgi:alpha-L-fucosidase 2